MHFNRHVILTLVSSVILPAVARPQFRPKTDFGTIVSVTYLNGQNDTSPLRANGGKATFLSNWTLFLAVEINEKLALYAETQTQAGLNFRNYGLSAIYRMVDGDKLNLEFGKFLVPFGNFLNRRWASENPLSIWPLLYNYRTALSKSSIPRDAAQLLSQRGAGYQINYADGLAAGGPGLRIFDRNVYLTGAQIFGRFGRLAYNFGAANGAISNPSQINQNDGVQLIGRLSFEPTLGLAFGGSFSSGVYLERSVAGTAGLANDFGDYRQFAVGSDLSFVAGHLEFFGEAMHNRWQTPFLSDDLDAIAVQLEFKYKLLARLYLAGRFSRISFGEISDPLDADGDGRLREPWDFDVDQVEVGAGYRFNRNGLAKLLYVRNRTDIPDGNDPNDDSLALQLVVSF